MFWINIIKEVLVSFAAIVTSIVAIKGLSIWRTQLKGQSEYQLAKKILQKSYEFQEVLRDVRSPFMSVGELNLRKEILCEEKLRNEDEEDAAILDESFAYFERFKRLQKVTTSLRVLKYEAVALWGKDNIKDIENLIEKEKELFINYDMYIRGKLHGWDEREERMKFYEVMYYMGNDDKFVKAINEILGGMEISLRKYVS